MSGIRGHAALRDDCEAYISFKLGGAGADRWPSIHTGLTRGMCAHTLLDYVAVGGDWWMSNKETTRYMRLLIESSLSNIRDTSMQHTRSGVTHHNGESGHIAYLERPFHLARAAVRECAERLGVRV